MCPRPVTLIPNPPTHCATHSCWAWTWTHRPVGHPHPGTRADTERSAAGAQCTRDTPTHHASLLCFIVGARPMWWLVFSGALALKLKVVCRLIELVQLLRLIRLLFFAASASLEGPALDDWAMCCKLASWPCAAAARAAVASAPCLPQVLALAPAPSGPPVVASHGGAG